MNWIDRMPAGLIPLAATLRRFGRILIPFAGVLASCSPAQIVNALVPRNGFALTADRPYGKLARQTLDIYTPAASDHRSPVVIFFYGGNWQTGAKNDYLFLGQALAARGYIVVIPDYRLYPEVRYPVFLEDSARAVSWTLNHLDDIGGDPARVTLMGHSAGAYIAAMLALDARWLGTERARLHSMVGLAGPYYFLPLTDPVLQVIFGTEPDLRRTQPITFADGSEPQALLISGLDDTTVLPANSINLAARIRDHGGIAAEKYHKGVGHVPLIGAIAAPLRFIAPTLDDVTAFLNQE
jgi:acetyl esterase/lipase